MLRSGLFQLVFGSIRRLGVTFLFPITAFVAPGFEHGIANMYFIPIGLLLKTEPQILPVAGKTMTDLATLDLDGFIRNLVSVTTGNIFGGGLMIAAVYWFIYLRPREAKRQGFCQAGTRALLEHTPGPEPR